MALGPFFQAPPPDFTLQDDCYSLDSPHRENALAGKSFAELGIDMKEDGKPRLEVSYYRKRIEL